MLNNSAVTNKEIGQGSRNKMKRAAHEVQRPKVAVRYIYKTNPSDED
jgi:hypothetical protein